MARPPSGTDVKLKAAGRRLIQEKGLTGFSLREACRLAGVNPAMFRYYFGSKDEFVKAVMKEMYAEFMLHFKAGVSAAGTPRERLKNALVEVARFAIGIRKAAPMIFSDLAQGKKEAFDFFSGNFTEHVMQVALLAAECRQASALKGRSVPYMVAALLPVMVFPVIVGGIMERNGVKMLSGTPLKSVMNEVFSEEGIAERAEIALRGVGL
ncbi:MAG: TetR/AcrR family transcriptional regulator [Elusimicrobia bacterium]|nr:TetR/AcrR family transcriptional regulator [Elusimicrobiota bacterium]